MRQIRAAIGAATIDPDLLTAAERIQYEGYLRREEDQRGHPRPGSGRGHDQGDRAPDRAQPRPRPQGAARPALRRLPRAGEFARAPPAMARGAVGGRPAQRRRAVAAAEAAGLPRLPARRHRVGDAPPAGGQADSAPGPSALGTDDRAADDRRPRPAVQVRDRHRRGDRGRRAAAGRGAGDHRRVPGHDPQASPWPSSNRGWSGRDRASSRPSPTASSRTRRRSPPRSPRPGRTARPRGRSPSSSSSNARCTAAERSTCSRHASSAPRRPSATKTAPEPKLHADQHDRRRAEQLARPVPGRGRGVAEEPGGGRTGCRDRTGCRPRSVS